MTQSSGKFWLIAAGTSKFDDPSWDALEEVPDEIALITNFFQEIGYVRVLAEISINSKRQDFGKALRSWCTSVERKPSDRVVIYYTGHGERADRHYLAFSDSSGPSNLYSSGYAVEDLIRDVLYQTPIQNLMLLLDTCYAGAGIEDALSLASGANAQKDQRVSTHVYFMASATPIQKARERRFAQAFTQAARNADGLTDLGLSEYLHPDKLVQRVNALMKGQSARGSSANVSAEPIFIPNLRRKALLDIYRSDLETHWIPRLRGTEQQAGAWYFTGRETALRALKEWLKNSTSEGKTRVVTGGPGSGKSAILAWLVASSDPEIRCLPDAHALKFSADGLAPGTIDCAVHLRNKTLAEVTTQIALRFGFTAIAEKALGQTGTNAESTAALLAGELIRRERKTVILADALDESLDAQMITRALLSPLTGCGHIWFLIGSRPQNVPGSGPILPALGPSVLEVDLDREPYADKDDVRNYVKHRLLAVFEPGVTTPYRNQPELAQTVAEGVAARVKTSFLIARLVVRDLLSRGSTVDTKTTDWQSQFPEEVNAALANDLAQFDREPMSELRKQDVIDMLEPLAYAQGAGLPIDLWPDVASASAGKEIRARDVRALLERAPYYLVAGGSRDLPSYRPFHQALVDFLRRPGRERTVHRAIVEAAIRNIPKLPSQSRNWQKAHFYALAHLATHAAACDMLDELLSEPGFITAGAPRSVLLSFDAAKEKVSQRMAKAYELVAHLIPGELPGNRASYLQLAAIQLGFPEVVSAFRDLDLTRSWYPAWARWSAVAPHRVIARHDSLAAVAAGRFEGRPILATGARGQVPIIFWDAETGEPVAAPPAPNAQATAEFLLWTELDDQPLVVAAGHEGTVWAMRPSGVLVWAVPPFTVDPKKASIRALAAGVREHLPVILCGQQDGHAIIRDARTGKAVREFWNAASISAFTVVSHQDHQYIVTGSWDGSLSTRDLGSGELVRIIEGDGTAVRGLCSALDPERPLIVSNEQPGRIRVLDPVTGTIERDFRLDDYYFADGFAVTELDGRPTVVVGTNSGTLIVRDLETGRPSAPSQRGGDSAIEGLTILEPDKLVFCADRSSVIRRWDLRADSWTGGAVSNIIANLATGRWRGHKVVAAACHDRWVRIWDRSNGELIAEHEEIFEKSAIGPLALDDSIPGKERIMIAGSPGSIRIWDGTSTSEIGMNLRGEQKLNYVISLRSFQAKGHTFVATSELDGTVRVFDVDAGVERVFAERSGTCLDVSYAGDEIVLVTGTPHRAVFGLDPLSLRLVGEAPVPAHADHDRIMAITCGMYRGEPIVAAATARSRQVWIWSLRTSRSVAGPFETPGGFATALALGSVGELPVIVIGTVEGKLTVRNLETGAVFCHVDLGANISSMAMPGKSEFIAGCASGIVSVRLS